MAVNVGRSDVRVDWKAGKLSSRLTAVDHKRVGMLYIGTSVVVLVLAGLLAILMRAQLTVPSSSAIGEGRFRELVTVHGTAMVFFFVLPIVAGFLLYLTPLMVGARSIAFPRLGALSYWLFLIGAIVLFGSFFADGGASKAGWAGSPPLSEKAATPGNGVELWIISLILVCTALALVTANVIATVANGRAEGMTWQRLPLFVWGGFVYSCVATVMLGIMTGGLILLLVDRQFDGAHFFKEGSGNPLAWDRLFWALGHPEVYLLVIPTLAIIAEIIPVFTRRPIVGYAGIVWTTGTIGGLVLLVWLHHVARTGYSRGEDVYATGLNGYYLFLMLLVAVPVAVKAVLWILSLRDGAVVLATPMLYALGAALVFLVGGATGLVLAIDPDEQDVRGTYFTVGHLHYALVGGAVLAILGALHYWWPKFTGRMLDERQGKATFGLIFLGFNLAFVPQIVLGPMGMKAGSYTYPDRSGWEALNVLSTTGSAIMALGVVLLVANVLVSLRTGRRVDADPWRANTLEWFAASPPPPHNFDALPEIESARPVHDLRAKLGMADD